MKDERTAVTIPTRAYIEAMVLRSLKTVGAHGYTVREFLLDVPNSHHGQVSGIFSNMHQAGVLACLRERRNDYCVYVLPRYVNERPKRPHASVTRLSKREELLARADDVDEVLSDGYSVALIENLHALLNEIDRQYR